MSTELLIFLLPALLGRYIMISWSILFKIGVFKVKVRLKVQNFSDSFCALYLLYH